MRIVILCKEDLIQWIVADGPVEVLHLDADVPKLCPQEKGDPMALCMVNIGGVREVAACGPFPVTVDPKVVEHYFHHAAKADRNRPAALPDTWS